MRERPNIRLLPVPCQVRLWLAITGRWTPLPRGAVIRTVRLRFRARGSKRIGLKKIFRLALDDHFGRVYAHVIEIETQSQIFEGLAGRVNARRETEREALVDPLITRARRMTRPAPPSYMEVRRTCPPALSQ